MKYYEIAACPALERTSGDDVLALHLYLQLSIAQLTGCFLMIRVYIINAAGPAINFQPSFPNSSHTEKVKP